ncbi:MAG: hypothetical protein IT376_20205 [Polyangiaceae bacterium]|nr:hypothetical protein [Polyangiaceae bacterium]
MPRWPWLCALAAGGLTGPSRAVPTARFDELPPAPPAPPPAQSEPASVSPAPAPPAPPARPPRDTAPPVPAARASGECLPSALRLIARARQHEARADAAFAIRAYTDAVQVDPGCGEAWLGLARARERSGDRVEAEALYGRAARIRGAAPDALGARGLLRWGEARHEEALADLGAAYELSGAERWRRELVSRYVERRLWVAALALWRRRLAAVEPGSAEHTEASIQVQALTLLSGELDPVRDPTAPRWERRAMARIAARTATPLTNRR